VRQATPAGVGCEGEFPEQEYNLIQRFTAQHCTHRIYPLALLSAWQACIRFSTLHPAIAMDITGSEWAKS
jgi:hypothetical protein